METKFYDRWQAVKARLLQADELPGVVKWLDQGIVFKDWKRSWRPPYTSASVLRHAIDMACADPVHAYVDHFRDYALRVLDMARKDTQRWAQDADWGRPPFGPGYWYETVSLYEQAAAWQQDAEIEAAPMLDACRRYVASAPALKGGVLWSYSNQVEMLGAMLWLLYLGAIDEAKQALALRKSYRYAAQMHAWVRELARIWPTNGGIADDVVMTHFDSLYEQVRDPDWRKVQLSIREQEAAGQCFPSMQGLFRLQLALLRWRLQGRPLAGQWAHLIGEMAA